MNISIKSKPVSPHWSESPSPLLRNWASNIHEVDCWPEFFGQIYRFFSNEIAKDWVIFIRREKAICEEWRTCNHNGLLRMSRWPGRRCGLCTSGLYRNVPRFCHSLLVEVGFPGVQVSVELILIEVIIKIKYVKIFEFNDNQLMNWIL